jgi:glycolate oxidase FAD binding subunit
MTTIGDLVSRLQSVLGCDHVSAVEEELQEFTIVGLVPSAVVRPGSAAEVAGIVRFALSEKIALIPCGSGSKLEVGPPPSRYDVAVDMTRLNSIAHYDAGDLTLAVDAGASLRQLTEFLAEQKQILPLAVPCFESCTVGGVVGSGIDSSLRLQYGTARDFLIGAEFVDGTGKLCKSGGRVVKNVTDYDLHKLLIGSLGTLGIITRLNFRTYPMPESSCGHVATFVELEDALLYRESVLAAGLPMANVEVLSPEISSILGGILKRGDLELPVCMGPAKWCVYVSFEGQQSVLQRIARELEKCAEKVRAQDHTTLENEMDETLGGMLREAFEWLRWSAAHVVLLRISLASLRVTDLVEFAHLAHANSLRHALLVRAAGIVYFALMAEGLDDTAISSLLKATAAVFHAVQNRKGHFKILHGPRILREALVGKISNEIDLSMENRVRQAFDPHNIFAPGRTVGAF